MTDETLVWNDYTTDARPIHTWNFETETYASFFNTPTEAPNGFAAYNESVFIQIGRFANHTYFRHELWQPETNQTRILDLPANIFPRWATGKFATASATEDGQIVFWVVDLETGNAVRPNPQWFEIEPQVEMVEPRNHFIVGSTIYQPIQDLRPGQAETRLHKYDAMTGELVDTLHFPGVLFSGMQGNPNDASALVIRGLASDWFQHGEAWNRTAWIYRPGADQEWTQLPELMEDDEELGAWNYNRDWFVYQAATNRGAGPAEERALWGVHVPSMTRHLILNVTPEFRSYEIQTNGEILVSSGKAYRGGNPSVTERLETKAQLFWMELPTV